MLLKINAIFATLFSIAVAAVLPSPDQLSHIASSRHESHQSPLALPLIIWHGLGDAFDSDGIKAVGELYRQQFPDAFVYFVHLGDDGDADRHASFFGNLTEQVKNVCDDIQDVTEIAKAKAVNAIGFSQGGVFLRGLVERCDAVIIKNLVTFGSPHSGISEFAECGDNDWWCKIWSGTLKGNTWSSFAQSSLVPAQYFRDPENIDDFLDHSNFLADVNNERKEKAAIYKKRIAALDRFVMYKFQDEEVIHPPESSWFSESNATSGLVTRLKERDLYKEDWLGLKRLDKKDGLIFRTTPGKHMRIEEDALKEAFDRYFSHSSEFNEGPASSKGDQQVMLGSARSPSYYAEHVAKTRVSGDTPAERAQAPQSDFLDRYAEELSYTFN